MKAKQCWNIAQNVSKLYVATPHNIHTILQLLTLLLYNLKLKYSLQQFQGV